MSTYAYSPSASGHRAQYVSMFAQLGSLTPLIKPLNLKVFAKMLMAKKLFLVTFDDKMWAYTLLVFLRAIIGRKTAGLSLRAQSCFDPPKAKAMLKKIWFKGLKHLPNFTLLTPVPYSWRPNFETISNGWIYDPQFWDLYYRDGKELKLHSSTALSDSILGLAKGRSIVMFIGTVSKSKGFEAFQQITLQNQQRGENLIFVAAGKVLPDAADAAQKFEEIGGCLISRFISDEELESLYSISDMIWGCYAPEYDQTSGVFGRAIQLAIPICVRDGSFVSSISSKVISSHLNIPYDNSLKSLDLILSYLKSGVAEGFRPPGAANIQQLENWTERSKAVILSSIGAQSVVINMNTTL